MLSMTLHTGRVPIRHNIQAAPCRFGKVHPTPACRGGSQLMHALVRPAMAALWPPYGNRAGCLWQIGLPSTHVPKRFLPPGPSPPSERARTASRSGIGRSCWSFPRHVPATFCPVRYRTYFGNPNAPIHRRRVVSSASAQVSWTLDVVCPWPIVGRRRVHSSIRRLPRLCSW